MNPSPTKHTPLHRRRTWVLAAGATCTLCLATAIAWFPTVAHQLSQSADPVSLIGHASYAFAALSFAQTRMLRLRLLATASFALGLVYNGLIHIQMPQGQHLWPTLLWLSAFLAQNLYQIQVQLRHRRETEITLPGELALVHPATPRTQR